LGEVSGNYQSSFDLHDRFLAGKQDLRDGGFTVTAGKK
jgi:hypothetical protein